MEAPTTVWQTLETDQPPSSPLPPDCSHVTFNGVKSGQVIGNGRDKYGREYYRELEEAAWEGVDKN